MSDTPRTDAEEVWADWNGDQFKAVHTSFARELEREIVRLQSELDGLYSGQSVPVPKSASHAQFMQRVAAFYLRDAGDRITFPPPSQGSGQ